MRRAMRHGKHLGLDRAVPAPARRRPRRREMGDAYPEIRQNRTMIEKTILAEENRFEAVLTEGLPRLEAEIAKARRRAERSCLGEAAFRLYDTFGVPFDFIEDTAATQGVTVDREDSSGRWKASATRRARGSAFGGGRKGESVRTRRRTTRTGSQARRSVRRLHEPPASPACRCSRSSTSGVDRSIAWRRARPAMSRWRGRRSISKPAARSPIPAGSSNEAGDASAAVEGLVRIRPGLPRAHRLRVDTGTLQRPRSRHRRSRRGRSRRHAPQPHGHAPPARGAPRGARHSRQAGGIARRARSSALRLRALSAGDARRARPHRADRQRADLPEHAGGDRGAVDRAKPSRPARWRCSARSTATACASCSVPGFSMELCGGTHVARPATSASSSSSPRAASRPACAASRR